MPPVCRRLHFDPEPKQSLPVKNGTPPSQAVCTEEGCGDAMGDGDGCQRNPRVFLRGDKKRQEIKEGENKCRDEVGLFWCFVIYLTQLCVHTCS